MALFTDKPEALNCLLTRKTQLSCRSARDDVHSMKANLTVRTTAEPATIKGYMVREKDSPTKKKEWLPLIRWGEQRVATASGKDSCCQQRRRLLPQLYFTLSAL